VTYALRHEQKLGNRSVRSAPRPLPPFDTDLAYLVLTLSRQLFGPPAQQGANRRQCPDLKVLSL
jgi:hypothetical protein